MERSETIISQPPISHTDEPKDVFFEAVLASRILLILVH